MTAPTRDPDRNPNGQPGQSLAEAHGYAAWVSKRAKLLNKSEDECIKIYQHLRDTFCVTEQDVMDFVEEVEREANERHNDLGQPGGADAQK